MSEILPSSALDPGPGVVCQSALNLLHLWCHPQKIITQTLKSQILA